MQTPGMLFRRGCSAGSFRRSLYPVLILERRYISFSAHWILVKSFAADKNLTVQNLAY